eukprot:scaffold6414_cov148-Isochrysis_galbana.AAC.2
MPLVGDKVYKGGGGSGRHRGGRLASPVRGHLLTQLAHKRHVRAPNRVPKAQGPPSNVTTAALGMGPDREENAGACQAPGPRYC